MAYFDINLNMIDGISCDSVGIGSVNRLGLTELVLNGDTRGDITAVVTRFNGSIAYLTGVYNSADMSTSYVLSYHRPRWDVDTKFMWLTVQTPAEIERDGIDNKLIFRRFVFPDDLPVDFQPQIDSIVDEIEGIKRKDELFKVFPHSVLQDLEAFKSTYNKIKEGTLLFFIDEETEFELDGLRSVSAPYYKGKPYPIPVPPHEKVFANNSWGAILKVAKHIAKCKLTTKQVEAIFGWKLGDIKRVGQGSTEISVMIKGFNHDTVYRNYDEEIAGISFFCFRNKNGVIEPVDQGFMNPTDSTVGGWGATTLRGELDKRVYFSDTELLDAIAPAYKYTDGVDTLDELWVPSLKEITGSGGFGDEGEQYDLFKTRQLIFNRALWTRTVYDPVSFVITENNDGRYTNHNASDDMDVYFGFCM